jgi:hypothetical protein
MADSQRRSEANHLRAELAARYSRLDDFSLNCASDYAEPLALARNDPGMLVKSDPLIRHPKCVVARSKCRTAVPRRGKTLDDVRDKELARLPRG